MRTGLSNLTPQTSAELRCRQIGADDLDSIADLLTMGFPDPREHWVRALKILSVRVVPDGFPRYGYMLEATKEPVGVILLIFSQAPNSDTIRCNGSAWYVAPAFRAFAPILLKKILTHRATHTNLSPSLHTLPMLEALGYKRFCDGAFAAIPQFGGGGIGKAKIIRVLVEAAQHERFIPVDKLQLLRDHERFGCLSLWCDAQDGGYPFIFRRRFIKHSPLLPSAQLIYCASIDDLVRFAGPIGRYLALRGMPFMVIPANGPIPRLIGKFFGGKPMYYRGPHRPQLGDLAYTEIAMFGP